MVYWYAPAPIDGYPEAVDGMKFTMHYAIRRAFQWILFPPEITNEDLAWAKIYVVEGTEPPADLPPGKMAVDGKPELMPDGVWYQRWEIVDAPPPPPPDPEPEPEPEPEPTPTPEPEPEPPVDEQQTPTP